MTNIHQEIFGKGKTIVLVHGWAMHAGIWREFALQLAQFYRVILVDLPGHGHSEKLDSFTLERITTELVKAIPEESSCWLGWSLGATVVLDMVERYPERVNSLILLAGNPLFTSPLFPSGLAQSSHKNVIYSENTPININEASTIKFDFDTQNGLNEFSCTQECVQAEQWPGMDVRLLHEFAGQLNGNCQATLLRFLSLQVRGLPEPKFFLRALKSTVFACDAPDESTLQGGLEILMQADFRAVLAKLTIPVLVILGGRDTLVPVAAGEKMQQLLPELVLQIIDRAGHVPFLSHSPETVAIISRFMDEQCI